MSSLLTFILAMVLNPDIVRKAQEELDTVIGQDRLPDFFDKSSLPYICAIVYEVLRWHPAAPLGLSFQYAD
jgi:cytochrome P450